MVPTRTRNRYYSNDLLRNSSNYLNRNCSNNRSRNYSKNRPRIYSNNRPNNNNNKNRSLDSSRNQNNNNPNRRRSTRPSDIDDTGNSELQLSHIHCKTTDDESETKRILLRNILQVDNEYEIPIDENYYQNNASISNLEKPNDSQNQTKYIPKTIKNSSKMKIV